MHRRQRQTAISSVQHWVKLDERRSTKQTAGPMHPTNLADEPCRDVRLDSLTYIADAQRLVGTPELTILVSPGLPAGNPPLTVLFKAATRSDTSGWKRLTSSERW